MASFMYTSHFRSMTSMLLFVLVSSSVMCVKSQIMANFVFGDSLVDAGNNDYINTLSRANYPPNGVDFPNKVATGRFTNGRTIVDILDSELGSTEFTPPYMAPSTSGPKVLKGVNYASGAGGILNDTGALFGGRFNLDAQIDNFENTRQYIISRLGNQAAMNLLKKSLFSVTIGSNDFINNYLVPILSIPQQVLVSPDDFIRQLISKYRLQLTRLYSLGARKIVVINVGPIGCIPYIRDTLNIGGSGCAALPNQLAQGFNPKLKALVSELSKYLQGSQFVYGDVYRIVSDITDNCKKYGFENCDSACCSLVGLHGGLLPCGPGPAHVCSDRSKYFFWDAYHPSDAANVAIAKKLLDGDTNFIFPMNLRQLAQA